jgi:hypothetical protein
MRLIFDRLQMQEFIEKKYNSLVFRKLLYFCYDMDGIADRIVRFPAKLQLFTGKTTVSRFENKSLF